MRGPSHPFHAARKIPAASPVDAPAAAGVAQRGAGTDGGDGGGGDAVQAAVTDRGGVAEGSGASPLGVAAIAARATCWARWTRTGNALARETRRGAVEGQRGPCVAADDPRALIAPCGCTGTLKYVHQGCLRKWLRRQPDTALWRCEICGERYRFQVEFRPAYEFLLAWPLGDRAQDPDEEEDDDDDDDDDDQNGARAAGGWAVPNEALVERGPWTTSPAAASATSPPSTTDRVRRCLAGLRRWWQALRAQSGGGISSGDAFGNGPAAATNRLLHWLHVLYVALFLRQVLRQCRGLHTAAKRALQLDSLTIAMQQGNDAIRALMETHA
eukprot:ctg_2924.g588